MINVTSRPPEHVAVVGASGFVGSAVVRAFERAGWMSPRWSPHG